MKKLYFLLASVFLLSTGFAQEFKKPNTPINSTINALPVSTSTVHSHDHGGGHHTCASHELTEQLYTEMGVWEEFQQSYLETITASAGASSMKTPGTNTISVIFHVVHNPAQPATNVSNALIMQVFNDMVEDFSLTNADVAGVRPIFTPANAGINFCLATQDPLGNPLAEQGVVRVSTAEDYYDIDTETNKMKSSATGGSQIWNRNQYLNIWICNISNGASSGVAGYAYRPTGGFLPPSNIDGIVLDFNLGMNNDNVLTHEVGHYLGLDHTWGGSGSCSTDDGFTDTPNTAGPSFNFPLSCSGTQQTCSGITTQYENYMDYSNCTAMFTTQQADFMVSILTGIRGSLLLSPGCDPTNTPPVANFTEDIGSPIIIPVGAAVQFYDMSTNAPTSWSWSFPGGTPVSSTAQNPIVTYNTVGTYNVTLIATNAFGSSAPFTKTAHIQVVAPATGTACDTLRNWDPADAAANGFYYYNPPVGGWGSLPGHCDLDNTAWYTYQYAERLNSPVSAQVRRLRFPVFIADNNSGTGTVLFKVYQNNAGVPGTVLASQSVSISDLDAGFFNEIDFTTPATVTGQFWVGFELFYGTPQDIVRFGMTETISGGVNAYHIDLDGFGWLEAGASLGITGSIAIDALLSNGPSPDAALTLTDTEICQGGEIFGNASGSINATNYQWLQTDFPVTTFISQPTTAAATFTFANTGPHRIYIFVDGSCETDGGYVDITVAPQVSATVNLTHTTCGNNNGAITVAGATGGVGTTYYYSLNGVDFVTTNTFTSLAAGNYTVHVGTPGDNCITTYNVTINGSTPLAATASSTSICTGSSASITATGGGTYQWFDGATPLGTTATISVSPTTTTQYSCTVTSGGCSAIALSNVTVNPIANSSFDFFDYCDGAPNGPVNIATAGGTFSFSPAPGDGATINSSTGVITGGVLGTTYTVQYAVGGVCPSSSTDNVSVNASDDTFFATGNFCTGASNVVSSIATPGGTFTYNGTDASSINPSTGVITGGVTGTTYQITYTTPAGVCQATSPPVSVTVQPIPVISTFTLTNPTCFGGTNGAIDITVTGTTGQTYDWGVHGSTEDLSGLGAGTYNVTVTAGACTTNGSYVLTNPPIISIDNITTTDASCFGDTDGTAVTTASGGVGTLVVTYGGADETALAAGSYTVTVTDDNGCFVTQGFTVGGASEILITGVSIPDNGTNNGSIDITVTGGAGGYSFDWSNSETTEDISGLAAGSYTVTVTDADGCTSVETFTVQSSVGIGENENNIVQIYPNPANDIVNILVNGAFNLQMFDARGRLVYVEDNNYDMQTIDINQFERGLYFIHIIQDDQINISKLIIK